jgi:CHAD domain-containing protein
MRSGPVLRRAFASRQRALHKQLAVALEGDGHAVHQARVATRRLREALPVLGAGLGRKRVRKLRRRMRKLTQLFGAVRERDVALKMLEARQTDGIVDTPGAERVRALVRDGRDAARHRLTDTLDAHKVARWLDDVKAFEHELRQLPQAQAQKPPADAGAGAAAWQVVLARRLLTRTERLRRAVTDAGVLFVSDRLHTVRVALKRLRYAVELAGELSRRKLEATLDELKNCQDTLGELHDLDMLMSYVSGAQEGEIDPHLRASLDTLQSKLETERHVLHARYLAQQPSLLVLIDRIQDQVVPRFTMLKAGALKAKNGASRRQVAQNLRRHEPAERAGTSFRR